MEWMAILVALALSRFEGTPAEDVLRIYDAARSVALEDNRPELLDSIYLPGSPLLQRDEELVASYERRGVDIERMRMTLLGSRVVRAEPRRVRLEVTDRLSESRVRLPDGTVRALPHDRPTRRMIELVLTDDGWRISAIRNRP